MMRTLLRLLAAMLLSPLALAAQTPQKQPLVQAGDMKYLGSFLVPSTDGTSGQSGLLTYGGHALGIGSDGKTLLIGCHDWEQRLAEVTIPAIGGTAAIVQPCRPTNLPFDGTSKLGGSLMWNGKTIVSGYLFYDASGGANRSHAVLGGAWTRVGSIQAAAVSGYMGVVPTEWRTLLGGPALTGQCCLSIISRTSSGPALSVFDPDDVITGKTAVRLLPSMNGWVLRNEEAVRRGLLRDRRIGVFAEHRLLGLKDGRREPIERAHPVESAEMLQRFTVSRDGVIHGQELDGFAHEATSTAVPSDDGGSW